jgi:hypothetical protein
VTDTDITLKGLVDPPTGILQYFRGDRQLGGSALAFEGDEVHANLGAVPGGIGHVDELTECVRVLHRYLRASGRSRLLLFTIDPLARHAARRAGMSGDLRSTLMADLTAALPEVTPPADVLSALSAYGVEAALRPPVRGLRNLARASATGVRRSIDLDIGPPRAPHFRLTVPDSPELLDEQVARVADTASAMARRFAGWWSIDHVSIDRSTRGLNQGSTTGHYSGGTSITLGAPAVLADLQIADQRRHAPRLGRGTGSLAPKPVFPSAVHVRLEKTVAHEVGHHLWATFQSRDRDGRQRFDRELGEALGGRRIADILDGERPGAPAEWARGAARVRAEVSDYAMKNVQELIAELFGHWWTRDEWSPALTSFGRLVDRYFPAPELPEAPGL